MISGIHLLRGLAAFLVLIYHIYYVSKIYVEYNIQLFEVLYIGVDIFFVVSGFVMFFILHRGLDKVSLSEYRVKFIRDRFFRIVPLYWFFTIAFFLANNLLYGNDNEKSSSLLELVKSLLFIPYGSDGIVSPPVLGVGWTLNYEVLFYLVIFIALLITRHVFSVATMTFVGFILLGLSDNYDSSIYIKYISNPIIIEFILGALIANLYVINRHWLKIATVLLILTPVTLFIVGLEHFSIVSQRALIAGSVSGCLVSIALLASGKSFMNFSIENRFFYFLGSSSYIMYLIHHPILSFLGKIFNYLKITNNIVLFYAVSCVVVYFASYIVEGLYDKHIKPYFYKEA
ncbi:acyltransferase family protein [Aeromonas rivipollensis]|uniref:acyltransferase family protein n=1 Tax=Aeromonas rivipollensis TaxID=948519 RepID=UPI001F20A1FD|nr:acyltransferase [Aeromonas rivipollensis]MCE9943693.1 acyltransferase [Aeromonas rivipollensis]